MMKKLYISILSFMMVSIAATTITYAWLSMSTSAVVQGLSLTTYLEDALEISMDGTNYYQTLPSELMMEKLQNVILTDVTSNDGKTFSFSVGFNQGEVKKNKDYISFDFHFRTTSLRAHDVYLSNNVSSMATYNTPLSGTFIVSKGRTWSTDIEFQYGPRNFMLPGDVGKFYMSDAMRVSFIEHPVGPLDDRDHLNEKIFDLSGNEERGFGKLYGATDYYTRKVGTALTIPTFIPDTIYKLSEFSQTGPYALDNTSQILTLIDAGNENSEGMRYYEGKVTMNVWVEGWDADLFNAVFGDQVKMQFEFKAVHGLQN